MNTIPIFRRHPWVRASLPFAALWLAFGAGLREARAQREPAGNVVVAGTQEFYAGSATLSQVGVGGGMEDGRPARLGDARLAVLSGTTVRGELVFTDAAGESVTGECQGALDPVTGRGSLKIRRPATAFPAPGPVAPGSSHALPGDGEAGPGERTDRVPLLLRRGVLSGGTLTEQGEVLAFRLELYLVVLLP